MHLFPVGLRRLLCCVCVAAILPAVAGCNQNQVKPPDPNPAESLSREQVIARLNGNNGRVRSIILDAKTTVTNETYPKGQSGDSSIVFVKPDKIAVTFYAGPRTMFMHLKSDGVDVDIIDFESKQGRTASVENLRKRSKVLSAFQPSYLAMALGMEKIDVAKTEMTVEADRYVLKVRDVAGRLRKLFVNRASLDVVRQELFKIEPDKPPVMELVIDYRAYYDTEGVDSGGTVRVPIRISLDIPGQNFKVELNVRKPGKKKNLRVNDGVYVGRCTDGVWRIEDWRGMPVKKLNDKGEWAPVP